jgi:hypothetical protein
MDSSSSLLPFSTDTVYFGSVGSIGISGSSLLVTGSITLPDTTTCYLPKAEDISDSTDPSTSISASFVTVASSTTATATLNAASIHGFIKTIVLVDGGVYSLTVTSVKDPGTGSTATRTVTFTTAQSIQFIWNNNEAAWYVLDGGVNVV